MKYKGKEIDVNEEGDRGGTPLHCAAYYDHAQCAKILVSITPQVSPDQCPMPINAQSMPIKILALVPMSINSDQCRSMPINADQFRSIPLNADQCRSIGIERHFGSMP